jgi:hypothetical protein
MAKVNLTVSVKDEHLPKFADLVEKIKKTGFEVDQQLESVGVLTGKIDADKVHEIRKVNGVGSVEESRNYQIAPPDSDIQ